MELWDLYDKNRKKTNRVQIRGKQIPDGCYHIVVHVWITNNKGQYLISQRSASREKDPLIWETVGGSVLKGEDSLAGALREVYEEVGIKLNPNNGSIIKTILREHYQDIVDVWLFHYDGDVDINNATTDEVAQSKWMRKEEIKKMLEEGIFHNNLRYLFDTYGL